MFQANPLVAYSCIRFIFRPLTAPALPWTHLIFSYLACRCPIECDRKKKKKNNWRQYANWPKIRTCSKLSSARHLTHFSPVEQELLQYPQSWLELLHAKHVSSSCIRVFRAQHQSERRADQY
ncbi:hypothetical protein BO85DRAFT_131949 [Aspergillus piperis CBS 112811]|uniref:Uncharacterized protein n=1 Tax=Aspergillus piperis CBS 112811 TaxID=1448313 RepID=A0A8G1VQZ0_9EURO|nr:hypothetical protein BO85DRAFT_131949 [Aspergillus piperis CBS 112811]RAH62331.1 hypothetical protein BO85DRAFT_131949 [Aspergillus piperis CBS 112811]